MRNCSYCGGDIPEGEKCCPVLRQAHYRDGGQTAALDCLGLSLGDVAARFLGPGDWRPYRKALTNIWRDSEKSEG